MGTFLDTVDTFLEEKHPILFSFFTKTEVIETRWEFGVGVWGRVSIEECTGVVAAVSFHASCGCYTK